MKREIRGHRRTIHRRFARTKLSGHDEARRTTTNGFMMSTKVAQNPGISAVAVIGADGKF